MLNLQEYFNLRQPLFLQVYDQLFLYRVPRIGYKTDILAFYLNHLEIHHYLFLPQFFFDLGL